jgi:hypothetical protein
MVGVGQLTDPYGQGEDDEAVFTLSGLPGEPLEPDEPHEASAQAAGPVDESEELVFELDDWSDIERDAVTDRLREAGIPHWWVDAALHVADTDRDTVEGILDTIDADANPLDADRDQVAYDMSEWEEDRLVALSDRLDDEGIAYGWDGDELFVYASDEQAVDELIDDVAHPHELPAEPDEGEPGAEMLGELFVAADRLQHDAEDHEGTVRLLDLAQVAEKGEAPYGLPAREWEHLRERVTALAELLREDKLDSDAVLAAAGDLRTSLRPYV